MCFNIVLIYKVIKDSRIQYILSLCVDFVQCVSFYVAKTKSWKAYQGHQSIRCQTIPCLSER